MVNVAYCMRRRADMTLEQFLHHWGNVHAPIVMKNLAVLHDDWRRVFVDGALTRKAQFFDL